MKRKTLKKDKSEKETPEHDNWEKGQIWKGTSEKEASEKGPF